VMSLRDGRSKMSKSDPNANSRIHITDSPEEIRAKIARAKTDSDPSLRYALTDSPPWVSLTPSQI